MSVISRQNRRTSTASTAAQASEATSGTARRTAKQKTRKPTKTSAVGSARGSSRGSGRGRSVARTRSAGPIAFFVTLFIVALGTIQLLSTFYTYALNLSELNGLKRQEAALIAKKESLENDIERWNDKAYVAAQARERLGFVFPGEQVVKVAHPEAVTGESGAKDSADATDEASGKTLPWYSELAYSFEKADRAQSDANADDNAGGSANDSNDKTGTGSANDSGNENDTSGKTDTSNENKDDNQ